MTADVSTPTLHEIGVQNTLDEVSPAKGGIMTFSGVKAY